MTTSTISAAAPGVSSRPLSERAVRRAGVALSLGSLSWAATLFLVGPISDTPLGTTIGDLGGLAFQLSLFGLLLVQERTRATGRGRLWPVAFVIERILLSLAIAWSVLHAFWPQLPFLPLLDLFWPLSMIGMFVIGVAIAVKGVWMGAVRLWPLVAESWAIVCVPALALAGQYVGSWLPGTHLLVGYVALGLLLALRPADTGAEAVPARA
ncbi:MAG TPA: hypothetical protein VN200_01415 [Rhodoglobus sp.]|nr:hypothetical protein [Rhodoglobus sp.]